MLPVGKNKLCPNYARHEFLPSPSSAMHWFYVCGCVSWTSESEAVMHQSIPAVPPGHCTEMGKFPTPGPKKVPQLPWWGKKSGENAPPPGPHARTVRSCSQQPNSFCRSCSLASPAWISDVSFPYFRLRFYLCVAFQSYFFYWVTAFLYYSFVVVFNRSRHVLQSKCERLTLRSQRDSIDCACCDDLAFEPSGERAENWVPR